MMRGIFAMLCVFGMLLGCGSDSEVRPAARDSATAPPPPPPPPTGAEVVEEAAPAESDREQQPARPAEVGVGRKGHGYGTGPVATPLAARWRTQERLIFHVQIPQAMNLFKASNGRAPSSHEEFMREIIDFNRIQLPELRPGERYQYDPAAEQLMVVGTAPE